MWEQFLDYLYQATHGSGSFRFLVQPAVAMLLGVRDGLRDASKGRPPYLVALFTHPDRKAIFREALESAGKVFVVAVALDMIAQKVLLDEVHLIEGIAVGTLLVALPYMASRGFSNRYSNWRKGLKGRRAHVGHG